MNSTRVGWHIKAPRENVYRVLLDAGAVARWKVPDGMTCHVHAFDPREGGSFRISLTYDEPIGAGKTTAHTDTYHGRFVKLVPNEQVVEVDEFETDDPAMRGEMTITITLADSNGGTNLVAVHDGLPPGVSPADNETGWRMALAKLTIVEGIMRFVCLGYADEKVWDAMSQKEQSDIMEECLAFDEVLHNGGHWIAAGEALQSARTAKTLRWKNGKVMVTDGPFAETKEVLGGFFVFEARDMNHAIELMSTHPGVRFGPFEIRPADEQINALVAERHQRIETKR